MLTPVKITRDVRLALEYGQWSRAVSILEQGIATLLTQDPTDGKDGDPISQLKLPLRTANALERAGIKTVGQLRKNFWKIESGIWMVGPSAIGDIKRALRFHADELVN